MACPSPFLMACPGSHGAPLPVCSRGTSDTECAHKQIVTAFGSWIAGVELSDQLLREWRHRYNHRIAERRRLGFPRFGHVDTWLIDELQLLIERNHGVDVYPGWSNTKDFEPTTETFGTVPLHSPELAEAMAQIEVAAEVRAKLTGDQCYLCKAMGTLLPLLPVHGKQENLLFSSLALQQLGGGRGNAKLDFEELAITWCAHVNGTTIFPKLPVYLRQHFTRWERNQRIKDALRTVAPDLEGLRTQFARDAAAVFGGAAEAAAAPAAAAPPADVPAADSAADSAAAVFGGAAETAAAPAAAAPAADAPAIDGAADSAADSAASPAAAAPTTADETRGARGAARGADDAAECAAAAQAADTGITAARAAAAAIRATPLLAQHAALPRAPAIMAEARADIPCVVAGLLIGDSREPPPRYQPGRKRGPDRKQAGERRVRHCSIVRGGCGSATCPGRFGVGKCEQRVPI